MDLSIIIPAYNAKDTVDKTLFSIKKQKISISFEVIIVNDCSDYDYEEFINKYKNYYNIREIKTKVNSGPGVARQLGIDNSDSKYIIFIDSDDNFYDENSVFKLYNKIEKENADLVIGNFIYDINEKINIRKSDITWLHGKIYRREFLKKYNIRFNDTRSNEDAGFNRLVIFLNPKYELLDEIVYSYNENENSITTKNNKEYTFFGIKGYCYNMDWAIEEAIKRGRREEEFVEFYINILSVLYLYYIKLYNKYDVKKFLKWGKSIKLRYDKYENNLNNEIYNKSLDKVKKQIEENRTKEIDISFEEFLDKFNI